MGNPRGLARGLATVGGESGVDCCGCFELFAVAALNPLPVAPVPGISVPREKLPNHSG